MKRKSPKGKAVARLGELSHGNTKKFLLRCEGRRMECLLVSFEGNFYAYVNRCCHVALEMDWVENQFFTEDHRYLICANHGATYEPTTGECIFGPCYGAFLQRVPLQITDGRVIVFCPEDPC